MVFTQIPEEVVKKLGISAGDEIDFNIDNNIVSVKPAEKTTSDFEKIIVKKLFRIKHAERTVEEIKKTLDANEIKLVKPMLEKKILFEYVKNGKKLIGIDRNFSLSEKPASNLVDLLFSNGFMITENPNDAINLNEQIVNSKKQNEVTGIRGFDKRFYVVVNKVYSETSKKLLNEFENEKTVKEAAENIKEDIGKCTAVVEIMKENGEIIEKREGVFKKV